MPVALSKADFIERVARWAALRGVAFKETRLNEWIKQVLVWEGQRGRNEGKKPVYWYGCRHYRRVLQLVRLYSLGIRDRDAILVQLFLMGYGVHASEQLRSALLQEFQWLRAGLNSQLRSTRFDEDGSVPPKHKLSMLRSLGDADARFKLSSIVPSADTSIAAIRAARSPDPESRARRSASKGPAFLARNLLVESMGGLLVSDDKFASEAERLIKKATDDQYELARCRLKLIRSVWNLWATAEENVKPAVDAFSEGFTVRGFSSYLLVLALIFDDGLQRVLENRSISK